MHPPGVTYIEFLLIYYSSTQNTRTVNIYSIIHFVLNSRIDSLYLTDWGKIDMSSMQIEKTSTLKLSTKNKIKNFKVITFSIYFLRN